MLRTRGRWRQLTLLVIATTSVLVSTAPPALAQPGSPLTPEQEEWLDDRARTVVLGTDDSYPPYVFFDTGGVLSGITADYVALIERRLGVTIEVLRLPSFSETLAAAEAREIDIVPNVVASEQRPYLVFTEPYVRAVDRIIVRSDDPADYTLADLGGRRLAAVDGYEVADFIETSFPDIELVRVENEVEGLRSLSTGDVEVLVADLGVVSYTVAEEGISNLRVAGSVDSLSDQRFGVRSDQPILRDILDAGLATITADERDEIGRRWTQLGATGRSTSAMVLWVVATITLVSAVALIAVLAWNRTLRRMVQRNTEDLRRGLAEQRHAEAQRSRLELAISHAAELVLVVDSDWTVRYLNPTYERVSGRLASDHVGQPLDDLFTVADGRETLAEVRSGVGSDGVWRGRLALLGRHDAAVPVDGAIASFTLPSGAPGGYVGTLRDVTREEQLRDELQRSERLRAVGTLAAGIAHDFNNLLTPIIGGADLIAATDDETRRTRHLRSIREAALRAAELVEEIRLFSLEQGSEPERFDLREVVAEATELIGPMCSDEIVIECQLGHDPVIVEAVPSQLHQLLMNLLTNATQAIDGAGLLRVGLHLLEPCEPDGGRTMAAACAELVVSDDGVGIDDATQQRIFEPYFSTRTADGGTGLGMFAVAGIVQTLHGEIELQSEPGVGTTVRIRIPTTEELIPAPETPGQGLVCPPRTGRILLVDDDPTVLDVLASIVRELGHEVVACASAHEAIRAFETGPHIDLLLTDLGMPDMRGDELAKRIRRRCPGLPIVLLTGHYDNDALDGDWTVLNKPVGLTALDTAIGLALATPAPR